MNTIVRNYLNIVIVVADIRRHSKVGIIVCVLQMYRVFISSKSFG